MKYIIILLISLFFKLRDHLDLKAFMQIITIITFTNKTETKKINTSTY